MMRSDVVESQIVAMFAVDLGDNGQFITFVGVPGVVRQRGIHFLFLFFTFSFVLEYSRLTML